MDGVLQLTDWSDEDDLFTDQSHRVRSEKEGGSERKSTETQDRKNKDDKSDKDDKGDEENDDQNGDGKDGKPKKKSRLPIIILVIVFVLACIGGVVYWLMTRNFESTDDAYTEGNAVSIAPKVSGYVIERMVDDNVFVHRGDLMLRIDPRDYMTARDQARANLELAKAEMRSAEIDLDISRVRYPANREEAKAQLAQALANQADATREYKRQKTVDQRATTQTTVDQATTQAESTTASVKQMQAQLQVASLVPQNIADSTATLKQRQAQVAQAQASLEQTELNLSYTEIRAPQDGTITRRNVDVGTYAQAGQQVFYVVSPQVWIVANFKETQLDRMRPGQHVTLDVDAYSKLKLHGHVESIQQGSGARFTTFPSENATGNYVKIVRRVPVKIIVDSGIDPGAGLPLGLSVEPTVDLR